MFYKIIIALSAVYTIIRLYEYYHKRRTTLNNKKKSNKINPIKKDNIKDAEFEEIE